MAIAEVRAFMAERGYEDRVREFDVSSATVELAAQALQTEGARIAKTIALYGDAEKSTVVLVVAAGDARVHNRKFRERFGCKPSFCAPDDTLRATGHAPGGVCPFSLTSDVPVYLDASLQRFDIVYPAAGSSNSCVELALHELETLSNAKGWVDVCNNWQSE